MIQGIRTALTSIIVLGSILVNASLVHGFQADDILGLWNTEEHDARIEIFKCNDKYCGKITWLKEPNYSAEDDNGKIGQPRIDLNNPDPQLRNQPYIGLQILDGFTFHKGDWIHGKIYNPENGKTYKGDIQLHSPDELSLRGYIGFSLFGGTTTWTRVTASPPALSTLLPTSSEIK